MSGARTIRLLLADVDETLLTKDKVLTGAAKEAARELRCSPSPAACAGERRYR
jgi:hydroxymethylpyrimidine pyrophosphatase-like HAD family hydrolase